jgi:hypothetical protein
VARTTVYLPDGLHRRARENHLNLSQLLADRVRQEVSAVDGCPHARLRCEDCGAHLEPFVEDVDDDQADDDVTPPAPASGERGTEPGAA